MPTLDHLTRGHDNLGRLLLVLESLLSRLPSDEAPDLRLMQGIADYVIDWIERRHNPIEELVLVRLAQRDPSFGSIFDAYRREMRALRTTMVRFSGLLAAACADADYDRNELLPAGLQFVLALRRRVLVEDAERLPRAARALDNEDWRAIEATIRTRRLRDEPADEERWRAEFDWLVTAAGCGCEYIRQGELVAACFRWRPSAAPSRARLTSSSSSWTRP